MGRERLGKLLQMRAEQPDDLFLLYAVAMEHIGLHEPGEAIRCLRDVLHKEAAYVAAYYQLGRLLENTDPRGAQEVYEEGIRQARAKGEKRTEMELRAALDELAGDW
jgi:hypothetical protein